MASSATMGLPLTRALNPSGETTSRRKPGRMGAKSRVMRLTILSISSPCTCAHLPSKVFTSLIFIRHLVRAPVKPARPR